MKQPLRHPRRPMHPMKLYITAVLMLPLVLWAAYAPRLDFGPTMQGWQWQKKATR